LLLHKLTTRVTRTMTRLVDLFRKFNQLGIFIKHVKQIELSLDLHLKVWFWFYRKNPWSVYFDPLVKCPDLLALVLWFVWKLLKKTMTNFISDSQGWCYVRRTRRSARTSPTWCQSYKKLFLLALQLWKKIS